MKIILMNEIEVIIKSMDDYLIKSPIGVFKDINDAIDNYPFLKEHKNIRKCELCGDYFIKYGKGQNKRKYCSDRCSKKAHSNNAIKSKYKKTFTNPEPFDPAQCSQYLKDSTNRMKDWEFHQDDIYWGLGESTLSEHRTWSFEDESRYIQNELRRIGLK